MRFYEFEGNLLASLVQRLPKFSPAELLALPRYKQSEENWNNNGSGNLELKSKSLAGHLRLPLLRQSFWIFQRIERTNSSHVLLSWLCFAFLSFLGTPYPHETLTGYVFRSILAVLIGEYGYLIPSMFFAVSFQNMPRIKILLCVTHDIIFYHTYHNSHTKL